LNSGFAEYLIGISPRHYCQKILSIEDEDYCNPDRIRHRVIYN